MPQQPHAAEPVIMQIQPVSIAAAKTALPYAVYKPATAIHVIDPDSGATAGRGRITKAVVNIYNCELLYFNRPL